MRFYLVVKLYLRRQYFIEWNVDFFISERKLINTVLISILVIFERKIAIIWFLLEVS